nr:hypothetical protein GCM10020185_36310 [Pseudomonas brassicacearum subsp. brassicacearum]
MSSGLRYGFWRGYWNALGLQLGLALQIVIVAAGVGAILTASATAFYAIKWFGVAYLVYLGVKQWRAIPGEMTDDTGPRPIGKPLALVFFAASWSTSATPRRWCSCWRCCRSSSIPMPR